MATREEYEQSVKMVNEVIQLLLEREGANAKEIVDKAILEWSFRNIDMLTPEELEKFKKVIPRKYLNRLKKKQKEQQELQEEEEYDE